MCRIRILRNGNVIVKHHQLNEWRILEPGTFCIAGIMRNGSEIVDSENDMIVVDCSPPNEDDEV